MSRRHRVRRARPDRGFTLVEMLIALVLSGVIAGVTVAAMLTSMAVIESTTDEVADSTDAGLISAYFYRDAQAAGITDPATALPNATLGISVDARASIDPWAGCPQAGSFVARFAWLAAPTAAGSRLVAATYALSSAGVLVRRSCDNGTTVDVELARHLTSTVVSCTPASCLTPDTVSLSITGSAVHNATDLTLVASVRSEGEEVPVVATAGQAPLLVLGTSQGAPCPDLLLAGTGAVRVIGDVVVSDSCGATPIGGIMTKLGSAPIEMRTGVVDPLRAVIEPAHACAVTGADPTPVGSSPSATSVVVYGQPVRVTGTITFAPGRYVFCKGLTVAAGATVTGTEVFLDVVGGSVSVESTATVNLAAQSTGPFANVPSRILGP